MELRQYWGIFLRWWWLLLLGVLLGAGSGYVVSKRTVPIYSAATTLLVNQASSPLPEYSDVMLSERLARTYLELLKKRPVLEGAIQRTGLALTAAELAKKLQVRLVRDTQLVEIGVEDSDPQAAAELANALAATFIEQNRQSQESRVAGSRGKMEEGIATLEAAMAETQAAIASRRRTTGATSPGAASAAQAELDSLQALLAQYQMTHSTLVKNLEELRLAEARSQNSLSVAEPAFAPSAPIRPRPLQNTLLALAVGLMVAAGIALLVEYLDDTVKTPDDVARAAELTTLGAVVGLAANGRAPGAFAAAHPKSPAAEAFRMVRTALDFARAGRPAVRTILITSANPQEGKSTVLGNLAVVMAQAGRKVVAVDSDLRRPSLHRIFGVERRAGGLTTALLEGGTTVAAHLVPTAVENLWLLPSGPLPPNPSELLAAPAMAALLQTLAAQADVILLDSPPVLAVADPAVLAQLADGVILVVDSRRTRADALARAREMLAHAEASLLGAVINKVQPRAGGYYYYYYYYADGKDAAPGNGTVHQEKRKRKHGGSFLGRLVGR